MWQRFLLERYTVSLSQIPKRRWHVPLPTPWPANDTILQGTDEHLDERTCSVKWYTTYGIISNSQRTAYLDCDSDQYGTEEHFNDTDQFRTEEFLKVQPDQLTIHTCMGLKIISRMKIWIIFEDILSTQRLHGNFYSISTTQIRLEWKNMLMIQTCLELKNILKYNLTS